MTEQSFPCASEAAAAPDQTLPPVRRTIVFDEESESVLQLLRRDHPECKSLNDVVLRALAVWRLVDTDLTVDGKITYVDHEGDTVRLKIF